VVPFFSGHGVDLFILLHLGGKKPTILPVFGFQHLCCDVTSFTNGRPKVVEYSAG